MAPATNSFPGQRNGALGGCCSTFLRPAKADHALDDGMIFYDFADSLVEEGGGEGYRRDDHIRHAGIGSSGGFCLFFIQILFIY